VGPSSATLWQRTRTTVMKDESHDDDDTVLLAVQSSIAATTAFLGAPNISFVDESCSRI
jgi:hypothetical protein